MSEPATHHDLWLELPAPAKLNLALAVRHPSVSTPHPEGLHEIASWVHLIDFGGTVRLRSASESSLSRRWAEDAPKASSIDWPEHKDLIWRAHRAVEARLGRQLPTEIEVVKRVPVGAGLGGGSSEAAAAIIGLDRLYSLGLSAQELRSIGLTIGSDVAIFLPTDDGRRPVSAIVTGNGETIEPASPAHAGVVLIVPDFGCETGAVYRAFDALGPSQWRPEAIKSLPDSDVLTAALFNDLTAAAAMAQPAMATIDAAIRQTGWSGYQTGSGSASFVLCAPDQLDAVVETLRAPAEQAGAVLIGTRLAQGHEPG